MSDWRKCILKSRRKNINCAACPTSEVLIRKHLSVQRKLQIDQRWDLHQSYNVADLGPQMFGMVCFSRPTSYSRHRACTRLLHLYRPWVFNGMHRHPPMAVILVERDFHTSLTYVTVLPTRLDPKLRQCGDVQAGAGKSELPVFRVHIDNHFYPRGRGLYVVCRLFFNTVGSK